MNLAAVITLPARSGTVREVARMPLYVPTTLRRTGRGLQTDAARRPPAACGSRLWSGSRPRCRLARTMTNASGYRDRSAMLQDGKASTGNDSDGQHWGGQAVSIGCKSPFQTASRSPVR